MRILHVSSEYPPQKVFGLGRYVSDLSRELAAQGHEVSVLTNSIGGADRDVLDGGVHVHRVEFPPPPMPPTPAAPVMAYNVHLQQRAASLGAKGLGDPEVVVSHDWLTAVAGHRIARRLGVPHVWTVHDTVHGKRFGKVTEVDDRVAFAVERWATSEADFVLVNSAAIGEEIARVYGAVPERVGLLHPGVDPAACRSVQGDARLAGFRSALAGPDQVLVTYAGRLDLEKGIDTLINAFALLKRRHSDVRLAIAGRGVLRPTIEDHVRRLGLGGDVILCGYLEGQVLRSFYTVSDVHVCPSRYEPFGLVALEAMAVGTPVVVSNTGGLHDIVSTAKVGRTFEPSDPTSLADFLFELVAHPKLRRQVGEAGREHVEEKFSWTNLSRKAVALYEKALEARKAVTA
jgi:glycosyltransferase involved in cell wall biosynthesis